MQADSFTTSATWEAVKSSPVGLVPLGLEPRSLHTSVCKADMITTTLVGVYVTLN